ncbi:DUF2878 domain-containing protein [Halomonas piscis]|uniref:DUF2878 domain-containing protein n=1 Tax=Halomonas piscis TaxID=3031727 RepID=A0ABY9Z0Y3_9GAMM|nr:DUF2878 domain-containing protein [Halomonas piscis]WNK20498.1 DUF2878 domain-containing protein [Halomonas piscis]
MTLPLPFTPRARRLIVNAMAFEAGWLVCVLGGSSVALVAGPALIGWHLWRTAGPGEWRLVVGFALAGLFIDGGLTLAGGFTFHRPGAHGTMPDAWPLPLWLWMLWPLFATLVRHSLSWLWPYPWLATCCGAAGAALSYYGGSVLARVTLAPWLVPAEALAWGLVCALLARQRP